MSSKVSADGIEADTMARMIQEEWWAWIEGWKETVPKDESEKVLPLSTRQPQSQDFSTLKVKKMSKSLSVL